MASVTIHEFSTGIHVQDLGNGQWVSHGFTGRYLNQTIAQIPPEVTSAISNRTFAVSEGAHTVAPAIIARDLPNSPWSVVAVVSRGEDEKGRRASFYRYFLTENQAPKDGIALILRWMAEVKKDIKEWPKFDPTNPKNQATQYTVKNSFSPETDKVAGNSVKLTGQSAPYIWRSTETCVPLLLHELAKLKAEAEGTPVSWAFSVGALERPWDFTIIYPASEKAESIIQRAAMSAPVVRTAGLVDEQALLSSIKTITTASTFNIETLAVLFKAAENEQVTDDIWHSLFDKRGAKKARDHGVYSPEMVKLMFLRSLLIPDTLPELLVWLGFSSSKSGNSENEAILETFQRRLSAATARNDLSPKMDALLHQSIVTIIVPGLMSGDLTSNAAYKLFSLQNSLWGGKSSEFLTLFIADIKTIYNFYVPANQQYGSVSPERNFENQKLWEGVDNHYQRGRSGRRGSGYLTKHEPLIDLFVQLGKSHFLAHDIRNKAYQLAIYFSQIDEGSVRSDIYRAIFPRGDSGGLLNITVHRKIPFPERAIKAIGSFFVTLARLLLKPIVWLIIFLGKPMPRVIGLIIFLLSFPLGALVGASFFKGSLLDINRERDDIEASTSDNFSSFQVEADQAPPVDIGGLGSPIDQGWLELATGSYDETVTALNILISDVLNDSTLYAGHQDNRTFVVIELKKVLGLSESFNYAAAVDNPTVVEKESLIKAVHSYETGLVNIESADGIIKANDSTMQFIREDIKNGLRKYNY